MPYGRMGDSRRVNVLNRKSNLWIENHFKRSKPAQRPAAKERKQNGVIPFKPQRMTQYLMKFFMILMTASIFTGCKYYQYHPNSGIKREKYEAFLTKEWRQLDKGYVLVLHTQTDTVEFFDLIYNEVEKELIGRIKPFEGLPLHHYYRAVNSPNKNLKRPFAGVDGPATNQIHFKVNSYAEVDSALWKFNIQDIEKMDMMKQSRWNTWINLTFVPVAYATAAGFVWYIHVLSWRNE